MPKILVDLRHEYYLLVSAQFAANAKKWKRAKKNQC